MLTHMQNIPNSTSHSTGSQYMQFFQVVNKEWLNFTLNKSQKSVPQSQSELVTFPHIREQEHLHLFLHTLCVCLSAISVNGGGQAVSGRALPLDCALPPAHVPNSLITRAITGSIMHAALQSLLRRKLVWRPERQLNSRKCLNKIKDKENIYIYIHIIKSTMRKVMKRQVTKFTLFLILSDFSGGCLVSKKSVQPRVAFSLAVSGSERRSERLKHVWVHACTFQLFLPWF